MTSRRRTRLFLPITAVALVLLALPAFATEVPDPLPDPDGKPADMSKPVQVYILLGQSNMLGFGKIGAADKPGSLTHAVKEGSPSVHATAPTRYRAVLSLATQEVGERTGSMLVTLGVRATLGMRQFSVEAERNL